MKEINFYLKDLNPTDEPQDVDFDYITELVAIEHGISPHEIFVVKSGKGRAKNDRSSNRKI